MRKKHCLYQDALNWAQIYLKKHNIKRPHYNAELILSSLMKESRLKIIVDSCKSLSQKYQKDFKDLVKKRASGVPLDYIISLS